MAAGKVLGIDLGTTNSCMAAILAGEIKVIPNREGGRTTPSVVAFKGGQVVAVGLPAKRQAGANPQGTIFSVKRFMGMKYTDPSVERDRKLVPFEVAPAPNGDAWVMADGKLFSPPEVSARILAKLKADAESYLGEPVEKAVITVPAYFNDAQRQATKDAGRIAGLDVLRIINEPTAAALACGLDQGRNKLNVAVYDLGGGTFDITLLTLNKGLFEVRATNGDTHLGGDDFDKAIIQLLLQEFRAQTGVDLSGDRWALSRLKEAAEDAKIQLTQQLQAEIHLPFLAQGPQGPLHLQFSLSRDKLEEICRSLIEATLKPCEVALRDARLTKEEVHEVVLVGGMTRMPAVRRAVEAFFGKRPHVGVDPDEAIAVGAAIQGGILKGDVRDKLLLDVTPLSLGVRVQGGLMSRLIEKNTTIPTRASQIYTTANDLQTSVRISVYQGEKPLAADNMFLGDFELVNIRPAPKGVPRIEVCFDIDANGILRVRAKDLDSGQSQQIRIEPNSGLSAEEISRMIAEAQRQSAINKELDEAAQYRLTCQRILAEVRNALAGLVSKTAEDEENLKDLARREEGLMALELAALKEELKYLNALLIKVRLRTRSAAS